MSGPETRDVWWGSPRIVVGPLCAKFEVPLFFFPFPFMTIPLHPGRSFDMFHS